MSLLILAERCEAATGPDETLDADIPRCDGALVAVTHDASGKPVTCVWPGGLYRSGEWFVLPRYTASIDAALTLVPDRDLMRVWRAVLGALACDGITRADIPRLICAAALRAKASLENGQ